MVSVRQIEIDLTRVEDNVLGSLGYREYSVVVNNTTLDPVPEVIQKTSTSFSDEDVNKFIQAMGGRGNPSIFFKLTISRLIPEALLRTNNYWTLERDGYVAECLPVDFKVEDARYIVILGVVKQNAN